jgi:hypothetical protein
MQIAGGSGGWDAPLSNSVSSCARVTYPNSTKIASVFLIHRRKGATSHAISDRNSWLLISHRSLAARSSILVGVLLILPPG